MEMIRTGVCGLCGGDCLVDAHIKDGKIVSIEGNSDLPGCTGKICVKGAALKQYLYHPDRVLYPMKRVGERGSGEFERISWEEALDTIADRMRATKEKYSADQTILYVGHPKWFRPQLGEFARKYGTANYGTESSTCAYALIMAFQSCFGIPSFPIPDIKNTDTLVIWGNNPFYSRTPSSGMLMKLRESGKRLIVVDPRCTPTSEIADMHLRVLPGTDGALALGLAYVMISENLYDKEFVEQKTTGFDRYREYVTEFPPERVEEITSVPADEIRKAARWMAEGRTSLQMSASPVVHNVNGFQNSRAALLLCALTGNYGKPGGIMAPGPRRLSLKNGFRPGLYVSEHTVRSLSRDKYPIWQKMIGELQVCDLSRYLAGEGSYPVRNLISFGMNIHMWARPDILKNQLDNLEFFVSVDAFMTEASQFADIVLPCELDFEREQLKIIGGDYVFYQPRILEHGDLKNDLEILIELAARLGLDIGDPPIKNTEDYMRMQLEGMGIDLEELINQQRPMKIRNDEKQDSPMKIRRDQIQERGSVSASDSGTWNDDRKYPTTSGKIEFCAGILPDEESLPIYHDFRDRLPMDEYPFILGTGSRKPQLFHSRSYRLPWLVNLEPVGAVDMHPADAGSLGIADGETALLETPVGAKELLIRHDPSVHRGMVNVYHGAGDKDINDLIDMDYVDPYTGFPGFKSYCCKITKIRGEEA